MDRTERHRWWRPVLTLLLAVVLYFVVVFLMVPVALVINAVLGLEATGLQLIGDPLGNTAFNLLSIAVMTPVVLFAVWAVMRRPMGTLSSVEGRLRWRWMGLCAAVAAGCVTLGLAAILGLQAVLLPDEPFFEKFVGWPYFLLTLAVLLVVVPLQSTGEEYAMRGLLLQTVGSYGAGPGERPRDSRLSRFLRTPVLGIMASSLVFASLHAYDSWALADVALFGLVAGWLAWYTGGLEASIALHVLNNTILFALGAYDGTALADDVATGSGDWTNVAVSIPQLGLYVALIVWLTRRKKIVRTVPEELGGPPLPMAGAPVAGAGHPAMEGAPQPYYGQAQQPAPGAYPGQWPPQGPPRPYAYDGGQAPGTTGPPPVAPAGPPQRTGSSTRPSSYEPPAPETEAPPGAPNFAPPAPGDAGPAAPEPGDDWPGDPRYPGFRPPL